MISTNFVFACTYFCIRTLYRITYTVYIVYERMSTSQQEPLPSPLPKKHRQGKVMSDVNLKHFKQYCVRRSQMVSLLEVRAPLIS